MICETKLVAIGASLNTVLGQISTWWLTPEHLCRETVNHKRGSGSLVLHLLVLESC